MNFEIGDYRYEPCRNVFRKFGVVIFDVTGFLLYYSIMFTLLIIVLLLNIVLVFIPTKKDKKREKSRLTFKRAIFDV